jgi:broad specificity phosphatase PhoE
MDTLMYLTRHGETESSQADLYYGRSESQLTANGTKQVEMLSLRLSKIDIAAVYSSPSERCFQAAHEIAKRHSLQAIPNQDLIEIDHGKWEGMSRNQVTTNYGDSYSRWQMDPAANAPDGGESAYEVACRAVPAVMQMVKSHEGRKIVVVGHNTVNRILMCHFLNLPLIAYREKIIQYPASLNSIVFRGDGSTQVTLMNDISHWEYCL